jgi:hypothetical protein
MNDAVFFRYAQGAARAARAGGNDPRARIARAFRLLGAREARPGEMGALLELYQDQRAEFETDAGAARAVLGSESADAGLGALTLVCSTLLASDAATMSR